MKTSSKLALAAACAAVSISSPASEPDGFENIKLAMNMYSNQRAHQVGDLLTVLVVESTSSSKSEAIKTEKAAEAAADAPFFGQPFTNGGAVSTANLLAKFHNQIVEVNDKMPFSNANTAGEIYRINGSSSFDGKGSASSSESLIMTFTVRVVDMLENGVLVVRGERKIIIKNESVNMVFTGLVRVRDISSDNQVSSNRVADAHIYYENGGEVTRGTRPGYVWRFFQYLNPL